MRAHWWKGLILLVAVTSGYLLFQDSLNPYVSIGEAKEINGMVQVFGHVDYLSIMSEGTKTTFTIYDHDGNLMAVNYRGTLPANFFDSDSVVVVGKFVSEQQQFAAERLLIKCPSKYEGEQ